MPCVLVSPRYAGHALFHLIDKNPTSFAIPGSDLSVEEETIMHEMETLIFDSAAEGEFVKLLDKTISRHPEAKNFKEIVYNISRQDFERSNIMLGGENLESQIAGLIVAQHMMALGLRYIDFNRSKIHCRLYKFVIRRV